MRVFGDGHPHVVMVSLQHPVRAFRMFDTQVSPVLLKLLNSIIIIVFIPIFDRFERFAFARICFSLLVWSSAACLVVYILQSFAIWHLHINKKSCVLEALSCRLLLMPVWCDLAFTRVLCTNMSQQVQFTT